MAYKKTELIVDTTFDGKKAVEVVLTGIDLAAGVKEVTLDKIGNISAFVGGVTVDSAAADTVFAYKIEKSTVNRNNGLKITAQKMQVSAVNTWGNAVTADIAATVVRVLVYGI